jgi:hypothetical protein
VNARDRAAIIRHKRILSQARTRRRLWPTAVRMALAASPKHRSAPPVAAWSCLSRALEPVGYNETTPPPPYSKICRIRRVGFRSATMAQRNSSYGRFIRPSRLCVVGKCFATMEDICIELELIASLATVRKIQNVVATSNTSHSALRPLQIELQEALRCAAGAVANRSKLVDREEFPNHWTG